MKEDILEQLVDDYLQTKGYFTQHNLKFRPSPDHPDFVTNQDSNHSDIDVIGYNPCLRGAKRVMAVSCKSWQGGLRPRKKIRQIENGMTAGGRDAWRGFRELVVPKWSEAFRNAILEITGRQKFTYVTAVTRIHGDRRVWEKHAPFRQAMGNNPIQVLTFADILAELWPKLNTTVAASDVGRTLQLMKASGWKVDE
ncbi:MAG: hypothetical protein RH917_18570 [Lacipirellulaceae bacterium]